MVGASAELIRRRGGVLPVARMVRPLTDTVHAGSLGLVRTILTDTRGLATLRGL